MKFKKTKETIESYKMPTLALSKQTRKLFARCVGVLFVYSFLFNEFLEEIFLPLSRKLWSLSLMTVREGYINEHNIYKVFTHPLVLLAALFGILGFSILNLWQVSGTLMCLEYAYRDQPVRLLQLFRYSFLQIRHCLKPKNWPLFLYVLIIQPLINSRFAAQSMSALTIPEFIKDFIFARAYLTLLTAALFIALFILFIRYLYLPPLMILEQKDFNSARKQCSVLVNSHQVEHYIKMVLASLIGSIVFLLVPVVILVVLEIGSMVFMRNYTYSYELGIEFFTGIFPQVLIPITTTIQRMFMTTVLLIFFHTAAEANHIDLNISLPEECIKTTGRIFSFKGFLAGFGSLFLVLAIAFYMLAVFVAEIDPAILPLFLDQTEIVAHKGYSSQAPENTLDAFELAANCPEVDLIEFDVRETSDGIPVVIHDESLKAATGQDISVYDVTFEELSHMVANYNFSAEDFPDTRVPALDDVLARMQGRKNLLIEIKASTRTPELERKIVDLMHKYGIEETSMIHSGNYESLRKVKQLDPDIRTGLIVAISTGGYADLPYADFFSVEHTYLSSAVINQIRSVDKEIYVWTVNEQRSFESVLTMDITGIITDYPEDAYQTIHSSDQDLVKKMLQVDAQNRRDSIPVEKRHAVDYSGGGD